MQVPLACCIALSHREAGSGGLGANGDRMQMWIWFAVNVTLKQV
jgi:hypothetical protein